MNLKPWMKIFIPIAFVVTMGFYVTSFFVEQDWVEIVGVTLLTTFYQACFRPLIGCIINAIYHNKMNFERKWFKEKKFEKGLYKFLGVKYWKNILPTYDKEAFDFKNKPIEEILGATCQAEVVHELMLVASLPPLLLIIPYGRPLVFILTTLLCVVMELVFIVIQRYNRPRLMQLYYMMKKREFKNMLRAAIRSSI